MIYSFEAKIKINSLLDEFKPEVVHIHNIYNQISPSILPEIKKRKIPIVQTVHDYHLLAPNRNLFHNNQICEITRKFKYYRAILHKCVKNSYLASLLNVITLYIHTYSRIYDNSIDYFITPSEFIKQKLIEYGFNAKKIKLIPNFIEGRNIKSKNYLNKNKYILYLGRLSPEKGITVLIEVMKRLRFIRFKIVGSGPLEKFMRKSVQNYNLQNVEVLGFQPEDMRLLNIYESYCNIVPSLWFEGFGMVILEASACDKPVIASRIGGIPEVIKDGTNGLLFEPGNIEDCISKILKLWNSPELVKKMGVNGRKRVEKEFNPEIHYNKIMNIYKRAIEENKRILQ